mmetsp:Transcript_82206/g.133410  ORF Transcript_82206/g.133410 Transcript_82206/m.133410 type:complete len:213 (-) Transcript_82206:1033-1671(-)
MQWLNRSLRPCLAVAQGLRAHLMEEEVATTICLVLREAAVGLAQVVVAVRRVLQEDLHRTVEVLGEEVHRHSREVHHHSREVHHHSPVLRPWVCLGEAACPVVLAALVAWDLALPPVWEEVACRVRTWEEEDHRCLILVVRRRLAQMVPAWVLEAPWGLADADRRRPGSLLTLAVLWVSHLRWVARWVVRWALGRRPTLDPQDKGDREGKVA